MSQENTQPKTKEELAKQLEEVDANIELEQKNIEDAKIKLIEKSFKQGLSKADIVQLGFTEAEVDAHNPEKKEQGMKLYSQLLAELKTIQREKAQLEKEYDKLGDNKIKEEVEPTNISTTENIALSKTKDLVNDSPLLKSKESNFENYFIPKYIQEAAYKNDKPNQGHQTIEKIISRGGYSIGELDTLLPNWRSLLPVGKHDGELDTQKNTNENIQNKLPEDIVFEEVKKDEVVNAPLTVEAKNNMEELTSAQIKTEIEKII